MVRVRLCIDVSELAGSPMGEVVNLTFATPADAREAAGLLYAAADKAEIDEEPA